MRSRPVRRAALLAACLPLACVSPSGGRAPVAYPAGGNGFSSGERNEAVATCTRHASRVARPEGARNVDLERLVSVQPRGGRLVVLAYYAVGYRDGRSTAYAECQIDRSPWRVTSFRWDDARPPQPPGGDDLDRARDSCRAEVERRGYDLRRFTAVTPGTRYVSVEMNLRRSGGSFEAACSWERRSGKARIERITAEHAGGDFVQTAIGLCKREANERHLSVKKMLSAVPERDGARVEFQVKIDNRDVRAVCRARYDGRVDFDL